MKVDKKTFNLMGSGELRISYPFEFTNLFFSLLPQTTLPAKSMVLIRRNFAMVNYFWKRKILSARRTEVFSLCISIWIWLFNLFNKVSLLSLPWILKQSGLCFRSHLTLSKCACCLSPSSTSCSYRPAMRQSDFWQSCSFLRTAQCWVIWLGSLFRNKYNSTG